MAHFPSLDSFWELRAVYEARVEQYLWARSPDMRTCYPGLRTVFWIPNTDRSAYRASLVMRTKWHTGKAYKLWWSDWVCKRSEWNVSDVWKWALGVIFWRFGAAVECQDGLDYHVDIRPRPYLSTPQRHVLPFLLVQEDWQLSLLLDSQFVWNLSTSFVLGVE